MGRIIKIDEDTFLTAMYLRWKQLDNNARQHKQYYKRYKDIDPNMARIDREEAYVCGCQMFEVVGAAALVTGQSEEAIRTMWRERLSKEE